MTVPRRPFLRRLWADRRGVSAVEFALIAAFAMVPMYFAVTEAGLMMMTDRRVTAASSALADLVAQDDAMNSAEVADVFSATTKLLGAAAATGAQLRITSIVDDGAGQTRVDWSEGRNIAPAARGSVETVPTGLILPGGSVVKAEVTLNYRSPIGFFFRDSYTLSDTFYLRPRRSSRVIGPT